MAKHFVEAEELQAYLDRELEPGRQADVERHLSECRECAALVADLKRVSATLQRWRVEPAPASLRPPAVEAAEPARRWAWGRLALAFGGTVAIALLVLSISVPNLLKSRRTAEHAQQRAQKPVAREEQLQEPLTSSPERPPQPPAASGAVPEKKPAARANDRLALSSPRAPAPAKSAPLEADRRSLADAQPEVKSKDEVFRGRAAGEVGGALAGIPSAADQAEAAPAAQAANRGAPIKMAAKSATVPRRIAYRAAMTVEVKEFEAAKEKLLKVVEEAGGYVAQASAAETPDRPRRADLVVRVPAEQLSAVLEEIRRLGRVTQEQLSTEEFTYQVVDLEARLRNARATEERLIAVLNERTGKVEDILEVEREIARTRQQIERMDAQRENLLQRVELATVNVMLVEEFQAQLAPAPAGTGTRLRNAFVEGYESFVGMLLGFVFFFARYGLTLFFWVGLLWLTWRGVRRPVWKWCTRSLGVGAD